MKKKILIAALILLAILLVAGGILAAWLLTPKKITKARLINTVNQAVDFLNAEGSAERPDFYTQLEEWLAGHEMSMTCHAEQKADSSFTPAWDYIFARKDGNLYVHQKLPHPNDEHYLYTLRDNIFIQAELYSGDLDPFIKRIEEIKKSEASRLQLDLPAMTEEDVTEAEGELIISNDYISRVLTAVINAIPSEALDAQALATIKTAIPGVIEKLGLRVAIKTAGDFQYAVSLSFSANEELLSILGLPTETDLSGELLYIVKSKQESTLTLRIADRITAEASAKMTYTRGKPQSCHLSLDMTEKSFYSHSFTCNMKGEEAYISLLADKKTSFTVTIDLSEPDKVKRLPPIEGRILVTRTANRIIVNEEEIPYADLKGVLRHKVDVMLAEKEQATFTIAHTDSACDTFTWESDLASIPWATATITFRWEDGSLFYPVEPTDNLYTLLHNPRMYWERGIAIRDALEARIQEDAANNLHYSVSYAVYHRMGDYTLVISYENPPWSTSPPNFYFCIQESRDQVIWPTYYYEVVLEDGVFRLVKPA